MLENGALEKQAEEQGDGARHLQGGGGSGGPRRLAQRRVQPPSSGAELRLSHRLTQRHRAAGTGPSAPRLPGPDSSCRVALRGGYRIRCCPVKGSWGLSAWSGGQISLYPLIEQRAFFTVACVPWPEAQRCFPAFSQRRGESGLCTHLQVP